MSNCGDGGVDMRHGMMSGCAYIRRSGRGTGWASPLQRTHALASAVNENLPSNDGGSRAGRSGLAATNCAAHGRLAAMQRMKSAASGRRHTSAASARCCSGCGSRRCCCCCSSQRFPRSNTVAEVLQEGQGGRQAPRWSKTSGSVPCQTLHPKHASAVPLHAPLTPHSRVSPRSQGACSSSQAATSKGRRQKRCRAR